MCFDKHGMIDGREMKVALNISVTSRSFTLKSLTHLKSNKQGGGRNQLTEMATAI
jgi:hypothetical protein